MKKALITSVIGASAEVLAQGGIVVMPTDTIFGMVARAEDEFAVKKLYRLRKRNPKKPFIILIQSLADAKKLGITLTEGDVHVLKKIWPGPVSVILPCPQKKMEYLHRGTKTLALRLPADVKLRGLIKKTGPLVAPSANHEGGKPATKLSEAFGYFGNEADVYIKGKTKTAKPSTLVMLKDGLFTILRQGQAKIPKMLQKPV